LLVPQGARLAGSRGRLVTLLAQLMQLQVDVIVESASTAALAAQTAAAAIQIVFAAVNDPVSLALVKSLARPGANITGRANITDDLGPKRMELPHGMRRRLLIALWKRARRRSHRVGSMPALGCGSLTYIVSRVNMNAIRRSRKPTCRRF